MDEIPQNSLSTSDETKKLSRWALYAEIFTLCFCQLLIVGQMVVLDVYFVHLSKNPLWLGWVICDFVVVAAFFCVMGASYGYQTTAPKKNVNKCVIYDNLEIHISSWWNRRFFISI